MAADNAKTAKDLSHNPSRFLTIGEKSASTTVTTRLHVRRFYIAAKKEGMKVGRLSARGCQFQSSHQVNWKLELMLSCNITVSEVHMQPEREAAMDKFRSGSLRF